MPHATSQHVGDRLEAAMRMIRKAGQVIRGIVGTEFVEHEKGIEVGKTGLPDQTVKTDTRPIASRHAAYRALDGADIFGIDGGGGHTRNPSIHAVVGYRSRILNIGCSRSY